MMVSPCCLASVVKDTVKHHPLNDSFYETFVVDRCESCGKEVEEPTESCDCCGEVKGRYIETTLGAWCEECVHTNKEKPILQEGDEQDG